MTGDVVFLFFLHVFDARTTAMTKQFFGVASFTAKFASDEESAMRTHMFFHVGNETFPITFGTFENGGATCCRRVGGMALVKLVVGTIHLTFDVGLKATNFACSNVAGVKTAMVGQTTRSVPGGVAGGADVGF